MTTDGPLAKNDKRAREDVGPLDRDRHRDHLIGSPEIIVRAETNAFAAMDIHRVIDHDAHALGHVVFGNGRQHRWLLAHVQRTRGDGTARIHQICVAADTCQRLFDALEFSDRCFELLTNARIRAARHRGKFPGGNGLRGQRNRTAGREAFHQHAPAFAQHRLPANNPIHRDEHILAGIRAVHETSIQREMAATDIYTFVGSRNQCAGDAQINLVAEQFIGIETLEREAENGRDRAQRDVAFFPCHADTQRFATFPHLPADDARIRHRCGVRAGLGGGEREAGNLQPFCQARQVVIFLIRRTVMQQQFTRPERIGHHHRNRRRAAARGNFHHHLRMRIGRKSQAAIFLRDDHAEEAFVLDELPHIWRQVIQLMRDLPFIDHAAQFFGRPIDKRLFFRRQFRGRIIQQLVPIRFAAEQIAIPPNGAGFECFLFGLRHLWQQLFVDFENWCRQQTLPQRFHDGNRCNAD